MWHTVEIELYDFFHLEYEDRKNGLINIIMNDDIQIWMDKNIIGHYDMNRDDFYNDGKEILIMEFIEEVDAMAFKLMWL